MASSKRDVQFGVKTVYIYVKDIKMTEELQGPAL